MIRTQFAMLALIVLAGCGMRHDTTLAPADPKPTAVEVHTVAGRPLAVVVAPAARESHAEEVAALRAAIEESALRDNYRASWLYLNDTASRVEKYRHAAERNAMRAEIRRLEGRVG